MPRKARGKLFGLYNTFFNAGGIAGPVIATYLYDLYRFKTLNIGGSPCPDTDAIFHKRIDRPIIFGNTSGLCEGTRERRILAKVKS